MTEPTRTEMVQRLAGAFDIPAMPMSISETWEAICEELEARQATRDLAVAGLGYCITERAYKTWRER
jgi:hypothetical protein